MSTPDRSSPYKFFAADDEVVRYRALSSLAVAGLLAGLLSPLAMLAVPLWLVPLAAVALSATALRQIAARWPDLTGRPAALAGLLLGAAFLVAPPADDLAYRYFLRQQARQFAQIWIDAVRQGEVYTTHQLTVDPKLRQPLEGRLADFYRGNERFRDLLLKFVNEPTMRTLFALGPDAEVRFYETLRVRREDAFDLVEQIYAVTYTDQEQERKTFFVTLRMQRTVDTGNGRAGWILIGVEGGVRPPGW
jgi:hypothetical protein